MYHKGGRREGKNEEFVGCVMILPNVCRVCYKIHKNDKLEVDGGGCLRIWKVFRR